MGIVEVITDAAHTDSLAGIAEHFEATDFWWGVDSELYSEIAGGARLDSNFLLLTFLSTVVAAIGLAENNVALASGAAAVLSRPPDCPPPWWG